MTVMTEVCVHSRDVCHSVTSSSPSSDDVCYNIDNMASFCEEERKMKKKALHFVRTCLSREVPLMCRSFLQIVCDTSSSAVFVAHSCRSCAFTASDHDHLHCVSQAGCSYTSYGQQTMHQCSSTSEVDTHAAHCCSCRLRHNDPSSSDALCADRSCLHQTSLCYCKETRVVETEGAASCPRMHDSSVHHSTCKRPHSKCSTDKHSKDDDDSGANKASGYVSHSSQVVIIGMLILDMSKVQSNGVAHVLWVSVLAQWRRRGVGKALMCHAERCAVHNRARTMEVAAVKPAVRSFMHMGYRCLDIASPMHSTTLLYKDLMTQEPNYRSGSPLKQHRVQDILVDSFGDGESDCDGTERGTDRACHSDDSTAAHIHSKHENTQSSSYHDTNMHTNDGIVGPLLSDCVVLAHESTIHTTETEMNKESNRALSSSADCSLSDSNENKEDDSNVSMDADTKDGNLDCSVPTTQSRTVSTPKLKASSLSSSKKVNHSASRKRRWFDYDVPDAPKLFHQHVIGFRPANAEDRKGWRELLLVVCQYNMGGTDLIDSTWNAPCRLVAVRRRDAHRIVALVSLERHGWVNFLACDPNYQRQGIGSFLLFLGMEWLRVRGVTKTFLAPLNIGSVNFYKHWGFVVARETDLCVGELNSQRGSCIDGHGAVDTVKLKPKRTTRKGARSKTKKRTSHDRCAVMMRVLDPDVYLLDGGHGLGKYVTDYDASDEVKTANSAWYYYFY